MKLFIWEDPYPVDYGTSLLIVVAEDLEKAKSQARIGRHCWPEKQPLIGLIHLGEPTRIVEVPCAEWFEWSE